MSFISELKQFVPCRVCLACDGCCRFRRPDSVWQPHLTPQEIGALKNQAVERILSAEGRVPTVPHQDFFICHFFSPAHNACGIYHARPFECSLYPFLLTKTDSGMALSVHLLCPYVMEKKDSLAWRQHILYLQDFFAREDVRAFLQRYPQLAADYSQSGQEMEKVFNLNPATRT